MSAPLEPADRIARPAWRLWTARLLAIAADIVQLGVLPIFAPGAASPLDDVLDLAVGAAMVWLVGWHVAFLPTFIAELVPFVDLFPSWTIAVAIATRKRGAPPSQPSGIV